MTKQQQTERKRQRQAQLREGIKKLQKELDAASKQEKRYRTRVAYHKMSDGTSIIGSQRSEDLLARLWQHLHAVHYSTATKALKQRIRRKEAKLTGTKKKPPKKNKEKELKLKDWYVRQLEAGPIEEARLQAEENF
jgi:hypothetical protein